MPRYENGDTGDRLEIVAAKDFEDEGLDFDDEPGPDEHALVIGNKWSCAYAVYGTLPAIAEFGRRVTRLAEPADPEPADPDAQSLDTLLDEANQCFASADQAEAWDHDTYNDATYSAMEIFREIDRRLRAGEPYPAQWQNGRAR